MRSDRTPPRLTLRGALALLVVFLVLGPALAFGIGIPLDVASHRVEQMILHDGPGPWAAPDGSFWTSLAMSCVTMLLCWPFYGWWADTHLWHLALWSAGSTVLVASCRRGLRVLDAALVAAAAVLAVPLLVAVDGPLLAWGYPDAFFMATAAAFGAASCAAVVRGFGAAGRCKRIAWGWLA